MQLGFYIGPLNAAKNILMHHQKSVKLDTLLTCNLYLFKSIKKVCSCDWIWNNLLNLIESFSVIWLDLKSFVEIAWFALKSKEKNSNQIISFGIPSKKYGCYFKYIKSRSLTEFGQFWNGFQNNRKDGRLWVFWPIARSTIKSLIPSTSAPCLRAATSLSLSQIPRIRTKFRSRTSASPIPNGLIKSSNGA